jgi:hypothetical protein
MISGALYRPHYNNAAMTTINTIEDLFHLLDEPPSGSKLGAPGCLPGN